MESVLISAHLEKIATRLGDKSVTVLFASQELSEEQATRLFRLRDSFGYLFFSPAPPSQEIIDQIGELPTVEAGNKKSQSQRMRDALYKLYEYEEGVKSDKKEDVKAFNNYYIDRTDKLIVAILNKIPAP